MKTRKPFLVVALLVAAIAVYAGIASAETNDPLPKPANVSVVNGVNPGEVIVSWDDVTGANYYRIGWIANADFQQAVAAGTDVFERFVFVDIADRPSYTATRLTPGEDYWFIVASNDTRYGKPQWSEWKTLTLNDDTSACPTPTPTNTPTPTQVRDRPELYEPILPPEHMAYIWWDWKPDQDHFREMVTEFTIHNDVGDFSDRHGLYLILGQSSISDVGFYFGVQTDANRRGKGLIFSRWQTRDLANARYADTDGWTESAGHEGDFIGVRRSYDWSAGDYRIRIAPDGLDSDGEWFGLWITDLNTDNTTWIGSLKFPLLNGTAQIKPKAYATIEIYGNEPIRPIDIPQWHISIKRPLGDSVPSVRGFTGYSPFKGDALQNSDVRYDPSEDVVHLRAGGTTERKTTAVGYVDFK